MSRFDIDQLGDLLERMSQSLKDTHTRQVKVKKGIAWIHGDPILARCRRTLAKTMFRSAVEPRWRKSSPETSADEMGPAGLGAVLGWAAGFGAAELLLTVPLVAIEVVLSAGMIALGLAGVACAAVGGLAGAAIGSACSHFGKQGNHRKAIGAIIGASLPGAPALLALGIAGTAAVGVVMVGSMAKHAISSLVGLPPALAGAALGMGWIAASKLSHLHRASEPTMAGSADWKVAGATTLHREDPSISPFSHGHHQPGEPVQNFRSPSLPPSQPSVARGAGGDPLSL